MSLLSNCYGPDIEALADEDGGFEDVSTAAVLEFAHRQWTSVATALGFGGALTKAVGALSNLRGGLLGLHSVALAAFTQWHRERRGPSPRLPEAVRLARAQVRQETLLAQVQQRPEHLWTLDVRAADLPAHACFDPGSTAVSGRAFLDDTAAGYFHPARTGKAPAGCAWEGPVYLSLGTFPWVYGSRLTRTPPGLDWDSVGSYGPAAFAMRQCASLWQPEANLRQDARRIVHAYRQYQQTTGPLLEALPVYASRNAVPGMLYRKGLLLHAEQSSLEMHTLQGPLGPIAGSAHNYIIRRFAAFFALRRSLLTRATRLTPEQQQAITQNPDPCVRPYAPVDQTAGRAR